MPEFVEVSILDLVRTTHFIHAINPKLQNMLAYAIEKPLPQDRSMVIHLMPRGIPESDITEDMCKTFIVSMEYIIEHPFWKGNSNATK